MSSSPRAPRVIILDEHQTDRDLVARLLGASGYEVVATSDASEVVQSVRVRVPQTVLVDLRLKVPDATQIRAIARAWFRSDEDFGGVIQRLANQPTDRLLQALFLNRVHHTPVEELEKGLTGHVDE